jgi:hypothetical protein
MQCFLVTTEGVVANNPFVVWGTIRGDEEWDFRAKNDAGSREDPLQSGPCSVADKAPTSLPKHLLQEGVTEGNAL